MTAAAEKVFRIKVTLLHVKPPVWRRILVRGGTGLRTLHGILQDAMGWSDRHLYSFELGGRSYVDPERVEDPWVDWTDVRKATLAQCRPKKGSRHRYTYDFGDGWEHELLIEDVLPAAPDAALPFCVEGRRACPPEDCGGPPGYAELLQAVQDPTHPSHRELVEWMPDDFEPGAFDLEGTNALLSRYAGPVSTDRGG